MVQDPRASGIDLDIAFFPGLEGDLVRSPQAGLAIVDGPNNVRQAMLLRLATPLADLILHANVGNPALELLSAPLDDTWEPLFRAGILECLEKESRATVTGLHVSIDRDTGTVNTTVDYREVGEPGERNLVWTVNLAGARSV